MAHFVKFETDGLGTQRINPDRVQRLAVYQSDDGTPRTYVYFTKDDWIVVHGELSEVAVRLSS
jgi:hypothetical protein